MLLNRGLGIGDWGLGVEGWGLKVGGWGLGIWGFGGWGKSENFNALIYSATLSSTILIQPAKLNQKKTIFNVRT